MLGFARFWVSFGLLFAVAAAVVAEPVEDWEPKDVLGTPSVPMDITQTEFAAFEKALRALGASLRYWKERGLPKPGKIDAIVYIPSYEVKFRDLITALNPDMKDVLKHAEAQWEHFRKSSLYSTLTQQEWKKGLIKGALTHRFFDLYAEGRYGFTKVERFYQHLHRNSSVKEMIELGIAEEPMFDNASYNTGTRSDLTEVLKLDASEKALEGIVADLLSSGDAEYLRIPTKDGIEKHEPLHRIVFWPRHPRHQDRGKASVLHDIDIGEHELGHHMVDTLTEPTNGIPLIANEVIADYIAASRTGNPLIGEWYATVRRRGVRRNPNDKNAELDLKLMDNAQAIRDVSEFWTIDHLDREHNLTNPYLNGRPLRYFLWYLRTHPELDPKLVDQVVLQTAVEYSDVPTIVTRQIARYSRIRDFQAKAQLHKHADKRVEQAVLGAGLTEISGADYDSLMDIAYKAISIKLKKQALEKGKRQHALATDGAIPVRTPVIADHVIPEFLRAIHRVALKTGNVRLLQLVDEAAGVVMNSTVKRIALPDGTEEIVFFRLPGYAERPEILEQLREGLAARHRLKAEIYALDDEDIAKSKEKRQALERLVDEYDDVLNRLITFERTGTTGEAPELDDKRLAKLEKRLDHKTKGKFSKTSLNFGVVENCGGNFAGLLGL